MSDAIRLWLFVVLPLAVTGLTIIAWAVLILKQTPEVFRRDRFNVSLFGTIVPLGIYLIGRAITRAGFNIGIDTQLSIMVSATFALWGWPSILYRFRELRGSNKPRG